MLGAVVFSGVAIVFPRAVQEMVGTVLTIDDNPSPRSTPGGPMIPVGAAVDAAQRVFPDAGLKRVQLPAGADGSYQLFFNTPGKPWSNLGASVVWVDRYSCDILDSAPYSSAAAGTRFLPWQFPPHNGDAFGLVGRWLVFVTGWLPSLLFGTGAYMWWRKCRNVSLGPLVRAILPLDFVRQ